MAMTMVWKGVALIACLLGSLWPVGASKEYHHWYKGIRIDCSANNVPVTSKNIDRDTCQIKLPVQLRLFPNCYCQHYGNNHQHPTLKQRLWMMAVEACWSRYVAIVCCGHGLGESEVIVVALEEVDNLLALVLREAAQDDPEFAKFLHIYAVPNYQIVATPYSRPGVLSSVIVDWRCTLLPYRDGDIVALTVSSIDKKYGRPSLLRYHKILLGMARLCLIEGMVSYEARPSLQEPKSAIPDGSWLSRVNLAGLWGQSLLSGQETAAGSNPPPPSLLDLPPDLIVGLAVAAWRAGVDLWRMRAVCRRLAVLLHQRRFMRALGPDEVICLFDQLAPYLDSHDRIMNCTLYGRGPMSAFTDDDKLYLLLIATPLHPTVAECLERVLVPRARCNYPIPRVFLAAYFLQKPSPAFSAPAVYRALHGKPEKSDNAFFCEEHMGLIRKVLRLFKSQLEAAGVRNIPLSPFSSDLQVLVHVSAYSTPDSN